MILFPSQYVLSVPTGVILPGETIHFSFIFKSLSAGIFNESWEFSTHPELLGGAMLQVTLWGIALYEDTTVKLREDLEVTKPIFMRYMVEEVHFALSSHCF